MKVAVLCLLMCAIHTFVQAEGEVLQIFGKENGAPKHFRAGDGRVTGYAMEIAMEAARRAGYRPRPVAYPWKRALQEAQQGKGIITAFSRTPERELDFLFSEPMFTDRVVLVYPAKAPVQFNEYEDLADYRIGIARGSDYAGDFASNRDSLSLFEDDGHQQRLGLVHLGRIDAGIFPGDRYLVRFNALEAGLDPNLFVVAEKAIAYDENHIGVPANLSNAPALEVLQKLNQALSQMQADGWIRALLASYAGET